MGRVKNIDKRTEWCKTFLYADGGTWVRNEPISMLLQGWFINKCRAERQRSKQ
jgi:hypothetical protein